MFWEGEMNSRHLLIEKAVRPNSFAITGNTNYHGIILPMKVSLNKILCVMD